MRQMLAVVRRYTLWRRGAGLVLLAAVAACAVSQRLRFERPTVDLKEVVVTGIGLSGGSMDLVLDVYNPNRYVLRTTRMELGIDLEDTHFGDARLDRALELPAQAHSDVTVPLSFTWEGVGAGARALITKGSVRYVLNGQVFAATPVGDRTVELSSGGVVSIRDLAR